MTFLLEHQPPQLHVRARHPDRPAAAAGADARAGSAGRGPGGGPSLHRRGVRGVPQRADGARGSARATSRRWTGAPKGGSPPCSWPRCRCRAGTTSSAFIAGFAGDDRYVVDYLGEEVLARQPADVREFLLRTSILERLTGPLCDAVTGRRRRQGDPGGARARQPVRRPARRQAAVVPVPPPVRRRPARPPARRARRARWPSCTARASAWFEANGDTLAGDRPRAGRRRLRPSRRPHGARHADDAPGPAGGGARPLGARAARRRGAGPAGARRRLRRLRWPRCRTSPPSASGCRTSSARCARTTARWPQQPPPDLVVVDQDAYRSLPAEIHLYRAALALAGGGPRRHGHAGAGSDVARPAGRRPHPRLGERPRRARVVDHGRPRRRPCRLHPDRRRADQCRVPRRRPRLLHHSRGHPPDPGTAGRRAAHLPAGAGPGASAGRRRAAAGNRRHARRDRRSAARARRPPGGRRAPGHQPSPRRPPRAAAEPVPVARRHGPAEGGRRRPRRRARAPRRSGPRLQRRLQPRTCGRFPRCGHGCGCGAASSTRRRRGRASGTCPRTTSCRTCASTSTSRWRGCCSPGTAATGTPARSRTRSACSSGCSRPRRTAGADGSVLEVLILQALAHQARGDLPAALAGLQRAVTLAQPEGYVRLFADEGPPMAALLKALTQAVRRPGLRPAPAGRDDRGPSTTTSAGRRLWSSR